MGDCHVCEAAPIDERRVVADRRRPTLEKMNIALHQIKEDDLSDLERHLPQIMSATMMSCNDPLVRKQWERVKEIVSNVRWNYGPPTEVTETPR